MSSDDGFAQRAWVRAVLLLLVIGVGAAVAVTVDLPSVGSMRAWFVAIGPEAWLTVVLVQAAALVTPVPRSALSVLVGAVAGPVIGLALVTAGGVLGGLGGYAISRWLGREAVVRLAGRHIARADDLLRRRGLFTVLTARVMPVLPFMVISYAAGLSRVRLGPYTLGTAVGLLPGSVLYVGIGASLVRFSPSHVSLAVGLVAVPVLLAVVVMSRAVRYRQGTWPTRFSWRKGDADHKDH